MRKPNQDTDWPMFYTAMQVLASVLALAVIVVGVTAIFAVAWQTLVWVGTEMDLFG